MGANGFTFSVFQYFFDKFLCLCLSLCPCTASESFSIHVGGTFYSSPNALIFLLTVLLPPSLCSNVTVTLVLFRVTPLLLASCNPLRIRLPSSSCPARSACLSFLLLAFYALLSVCPVASLNACPSSLLLPCYLLDCCAGRAYASYDCVDEFVTLKGKQ